MDVDLDNLVNSLNSCANVSIAEFDSSVSYSRISEFKKRGSGPSNQEKRRQQLLDDQKK